MPSRWSSLAMEPSSWSSGLTVDRVAASDRPTEFADAAGFAAATAYGGLAGKVPGIAGTAEQSVQAFTLMKVIGRDIWIGIWAFVMAIIATTQWETTPGGPKPQAAEIWWRFPKFVIGFVIASLFVTLVASGYAQADFNKVVVPAFVGPVKDLRTWAVISASGPSA